MLTHVDLFSGIGGFALAAQWAGFKTVAFVEIEPYAQELIKQNFGAVADAESERWARRDLPRSNMEHDGFQLAYCRPRIHADIRTFDGTAYRGATLLTGGFPCQPFSQAGKRRGKEDDRYLWPEMLRVISEARPAWVLGENVAGIVTMELDRVLSDLEGEGYAVQALVIPACAVDAKHRRDRVWIVGHADQAGRREQRGAESVREKQFAAQCSSEDVADAEGRTVGAGLCAGEQTGERRRRFSDDGGETLCKSELWRPQIEGSEISRGDQPARWLTEPDVGRVANGIPARVDRLKGLGNAIVPQVAFEIVREIARLENAE